LASIISGRALSILKDQPDLITEMPQAVANGVRDLFMQSDLPKILDRVSAILVELRGCPPLFEAAETAAARQGVFLAPKVRMVSEYEREFYYNMALVIDGDRVSFHRDREPAMTVEGWARMANRIPPIVPIAQFPGQFPVGTVDFGNRNLFISVGMGLLASAIRHPQASQPVRDAASRAVPAALNGVGKKIFLFPERLARARIWRRCSL